MSTISPRFSWYCFVYDFISMLLVLFCQRFSIDVSGIVVSMIASRFSWHCCVYEFTRLYLPYCYTCLTWKWMFLLFFCICLYFSSIKTICWISRTIPSIIRTLLVGRLVTAEDNQIVILVRRSSLFQLR